mgnify:CR=1 FL=1
MMSRHSGTRAPQRVTEAVRTICDCQVHRRRQRALWRRSFRFARHAAGSLKARGIAVLLSVPLALGALEYPSEAMHLAVTSAPPGLISPLRRARIVSITAAAPAAITRDLPIFTTRSIREQFLHQESEPRALTLDMVKEQFFRANVPYGMIIYREARRHNLPPELVAAVVEAESDFRPRLISHKNAQGLMQIIPSTAEFIGAGDLFNPADNIAAGTKYLRYLHDRFKGDQKMVLAAYNAGEGNVEKFGGIPPFPETINYLQKVNARARQYRERVRANFVSSVRIHNSLRAH